LYPLFVLAKSQSSRVGETISPSRKCSTRCREANRNFCDPNHSLNESLDLFVVKLEAGMVSTSIKNRRFGGQVRIPEWQREVKIHDLSRLADECFALAKTTVKADARHALTDMANEYLEEAEKLKRAKVVL
jgi:hypothetical protein